MDGPKGQNEVFWWEEHDGASVDRAWMAVRLGGGIADIMAMIPMLGATGPAWPPGFRLFGPPRAPAAASPGIPIPTARRKG